MFLRMFKADTRSVKKTEQPAALKLDAGAKPHPFTGLFKVQTQKDYRGRQAFIPAIKTLAPAAAVAVKPVPKAKPKSNRRINTDMVKLRATCAELLATAARWKAEEAETTVQKALPGAPRKPDKPARTPKQEIEHLTHLIATSNSEHEIAALRERLAAACAAHDKQERANIKKSVTDQHRANELQMLRGYLTGSAHSTRIGI